MGTCEICVWWAELGGVPYDNAGVCRRYPPMPVTGPSAWHGATYMEADRAAAVWPMTNSDDLCGEFLTKELDCVEC